MTIGEGRSIQLRHPSSVHDSALVIQVDNSDDEGYLYLGKNASIGLARILAFSTTLHDPPVHCTTSITSTTCSYPIPSKVLIDQDIPEKLKPWGLWGEDSYY